MKNRPSRLTNILLVLVTVGCIILLFFSDRGLISLWKIKNTFLIIIKKLWQVLCPI